MMCGRGERTKTEKQHEAAAVVECGSMWKGWRRDGEPGGTNLWRREESGGHGRAWQGWCMGQCALESIASHCRRDEGWGEVLEMGDGGIYWVALV